MIRITPQPGGKVAVASPSPLWPLLLHLFPQAVQRGRTGRHYIRASAWALERLDQLATLTAGVQLVAQQYQERVALVLALNKAQTTLRVLRGQQQLTPDQPPQPLALPPACSSIAGIEPRSELGWHQLAHVQGYVDRLEVWLIEQLDTLPTLDNLQEQLASAWRERDRLMEIRYRAFLVELALRDQARALPAQQAAEVDQDEMAMGSMTDLDDSLEAYEDALQAHAVAQAKRDTHTARGTL
ncbi:hypothetical protein N7645_15235 [Pseudomonas juntendi]|uniref:hypothetical protein n=1 Tax=Pseudomonas TaxID=286 RepID=UPI0012AE296C|nr:MULTISPECIES: hypothetical protein [Pseudomonas]MDG9918242.1 hypothetical protein [Pseudomonas juntendi]MDH0507690.1 hypothetical protein [Pseudomonas juntendi]MDH1044828.1 hypothetical protein [Pseudomonas juntendi]MRT62357.1 hypothetical protein [Pseudomonas sp. CAH-1]